MISRSRQSFNVETIGKKGIGFGLFRSEKGLNLGGNLKIESNRQWGVIWNNIPDINMKLRK